MEGRVHTETAKLLYYCTACFGSIPNDLQYQALTRVSPDNRLAAHGQTITPPNIKGIHKV